MKYSSINLNEPDIRLPLRFPVKVHVAYRRNGAVVDDAPVFYSSNPEADADKIVTERGWNRRPDYQPTDVWVNAGF